MFKIGEPLNEPYYFSRDLDLDDHGHLRLYYSPLDKKKPSL